MSKVLELFGVSTKAEGIDWAEVMSAQTCPLLSRKCWKVRKSRPDISIGTCSVCYGCESMPIVICPTRFTERQQVFTDCIHLLTTHEPGNELHIVREISVPGGNVDYFLVSLQNGRVEDFVGIEFQTLDTTGTVWPERQKFLHSVGIKVNKKDLTSDKSFGMNWKMTAKTILVQLHHKIQTFEHVNKRLVLVVQDCLLDYMKREFHFDHLDDARLGDSMHIHSYHMQENSDSNKIVMVGRHSTDADGVARCLGLQRDSKIELATILQQLQAKISNETLFTIK